MGIHTVFALSQFLFAFSELFLAGGVFSSLCLFESDAFLFDHHPFAFDGIAFGGEFLLFEFVFQLLTALGFLCVALLQVLKFFYKRVVGFFTAGDEDKRNRGCR